MPNETTNIRAGLVGIADTLTSLAKNSGVNKPPVTPSIDASQLDRPASTPPETPVRSSDQLIASIAQTATDNQPSDKALTQTEDEISKLLRASVGESSYRAKLEDRFDIADIEKQVREISSDIEKKRASLSLGEADVNGRPIARTFQSGRIAEMRQQTAAEVEALNAASQAALGNLATAESSIERAVQAKFGGIKEELQIQRELLQLREGTYTREEKVAAAKQTAKIAQLEAQINQAQDREKTSLSQISEAVNNGMSPQKAAAISSAVINGTATVGDVLSEVGGFIGYYDRVYKQLQIQNIQSQISERSAKTTEGEKLNATQYKALGFADRMMQADEIVDEIGGQFTGAGSAVAEWLPNALKSSNRQKYEQAKRNFVNAILRRESGAAISPDEFSNADLQYFPQPGDSEEVLVQKSQNRATSIAGVLREAGQDTTLQESIINDPLQIGVTTNTTNPLGI